MPLHTKKALERHIERSTSDLSTDYLVVLYQCYLPGFDHCNPIRQDAVWKS